MAEAGYYATDNWRLSLGASSLDGYNSLEFGTKYLFDGIDLPLAATSEIRIGQDGAVLGTIGLKAYFGGPPKSLLRRHREDDPSDRSTSLYAAVGGNTLRGTSGHGSPGHAATSDAGGNDTPPVTEPPTRDPSCPTWDTWSPGCTL
jgi:hypothetical protein